MKGSGSPALRVRFLRLANPYVLFDPPSHQPSQFYTMSAELGTPSLSMGLKSSRAKLTGIPYVSHFLPPDSLYPVPKYCNPP